MDGSADIVRGLRARDESTWARFLRDYGPLIQGVLAGFDLGPDRDDVFQEVCVAIDRSIDTLRDPEKLASWVYGVALRRCLRAVRARSQRGARVSLVEADQLERTPSGELPADERLDHLEDVARLLDALKSLREPCERLLRALYLEELSYQDVSHLEGIPLGSIGPTRARCLDRLRDLLNEEVSSEPRQATTDGHESRTSHGPRPDPSSQEERE